jgi:hypothetical protein
VATPEVKFKVFPSQTGVLLFGLAVGDAFIVTEPTNVLALSHPPIVHEA